MFPSGEPIGWRVSDRVYDTRMTGFMATLEHVDEAAFLFWWSERRVEAERQGD